MPVLIISERIPLYTKIQKFLPVDITHKAHIRGLRIHSEEDLATKYGLSRMIVRLDITALIHVPS